jgi:predicted RND superfamily exporter protein
MLMHATIAGDIAHKDGGINTKIRETVESSIKKYKLPVRVYVGGLEPFGDEMGTKIRAGVEMAELGSLPVIFVLLYLALGSLMASFSAWYVAVGAIFASLSVLLGLSQHFSVSGLAANIVTLVFGLGLGIDYALIIVSRFMEERTKHPRVHTTRVAKQTLLTSGRTVAFSAFAVFLALSGGLLFHEYFLASQCLAVMTTAILAAFMANTFMLSLLMWMDGGCTGTFGSSSSCAGGGESALFWCPAPNLFAIIVRKFKFSFAQGLVVDPSPSKSRNEVGPEEGATDADSSSSVVKCDDQEGAEPPPSPSVAPAIHECNGPNTKAPPPEENEDENEEEPRGAFYNIGVFVVKRPIFVLLASTSFLVAWTAYFFTVTQYGVNDATTLQGSSHNRQIYERMHDGTFPSLGKSRLFVYLESKTAYPVTSGAFLTALDAFQSKLVEVRGVVDVKSMVNTGQSGMTLSLYKAQYAAPYSIPHLPYTAPLLFPYKLTDLKFSTYIDVSLDYHQYGPDAAKALRAIRSLLKSTTVFDVDGISMLGYSGVGGAPALRNDLYEDIMEVVPAWLGILFASTILLLLVLTKSIVVPLKAIIMIALSLGSALGILMAIFPFGTPEVQKALGFGSSGYVDASHVILVFSIG